MAESCDKSVFINGRFLTQKRTGVQRYCRQVVLAIDRALRKDDCLRSLRELDWYLVAPPGSVCDVKLEKIRFIEIGRGGGHLWEQFSLMKYGRRGRMLSMGNSGPVFHRRQVVVIHDAAIYFAPAGFNWRYRMLHRWLEGVLARTARLATVSEFSRRELAKALHLSGKGIVVAANGTDHFEQLDADEGVLEKVGVSDGKYFVTLGLSTANKNIPLAIEAFRSLQRPEIKLVIAGEGSTRIAGLQTLMKEAGLVVTGHLSDEELAGLMRHAAAFVFPTRYEGFGIPPLEAMAQGCPVLASTAPAVVEVCGGAALHFDPDDAPALMALMRRVLDVPEAVQELRRKGYDRPGRYRWATAAEALMRELEGLRRKA